MSSMLTTWADSFFSLLSFHSFLSLLMNPHSYLSSDLQHWHGLEPDFVFTQIKGGKSDRTRIVSLWNGQKGETIHKSLRVYGYGRVYK